MSALTLGPVDFEMFEIPGRIEFGGRQRLAVHALPGGARVVDALGRDDAPVSWSGVFSGPRAGERARQLDLLRTEGAAQILVWDAFVFEVIIAQFEVRFERPNWIPYRIACLVLSDLAVPEQLALSLAVTLGADLASAAGCPGLDLTVATTALAVSGATTAGTQSYAQAGLALAAVTSQSTSLLAAGATSLDQAATVAQAVAAAGQMAQAAQAMAYLRRAQANHSRVGS